MNKDDLALTITRTLFENSNSVESFNSYQCIRNYFLDLSMEDLLGIASHYGINVD